MKTLETGIGRGTNVEGEVLKHCFKNLPNSKQPHLRGDYGFEIDPFLTEIVTSKNATLDYSLGDKLDKIEIEMRLKGDKKTFLKMKKNLIKDYLNEYVAIMNGEVVGHHNDVDELIKELDEKFGPIPLLISKIETEPSLGIFPSPI